jgi:hypothetical protein
MSPPHSWADGKHFRVFIELYERSQFDYTNPVSQRRFIGFALQGARPFGLEGPVFSSIVKSKGLQPETAPRLVREPALRTSRTNLFFLD